MRLTALLIFLTAAIGVMFTAKSDNVIIVNPRNQPIPVYIVPSPTATATATATPTPTHTPTPTPTATPTP